MITRREVALGGLLSIGWLAAPCGCAAHAAAAPRSFGCMLTDEAADALLELDTQALAATAAPTIVNSGDRELDYAMAQTLSRLTDTWNALPGFAWFDDTDAPNAFATTRRLLSRNDGTILFGRTLLGRCLKAREHPDAVISAVVAHEFGHIAQYKYGLSKRLAAGQTSVVRNELHADFLAGYGMAQAVPGPLFTFAAYLGAIGPAPNGLAGALIALVALSLPGLLLVYGMLPYWDALRLHPTAQAAMRGTNAAVVGILGAALYNPVWTSAVLTPRDFAVALAGFLLLTVWKLATWIVVVLLAAAGGILRLV